MVGTLDTVLAVVAMVVCIGAVIRSAWAMAIEETIIIAQSKNNVDQPSSNLG
jgi:hypothetical protein